jgi:predicted alpha-1,2-mannosidase
MPPISRCSLVSTFQGTDSHLAFSKGNTLPLTTWPHGMVGWVPQTEAGNWVFDYRAPTLQGIRATHQPSPWIGDYGNFLLLFGRGPRPPRSVVDGESFYAKADTTAQPDYFRTRLVRHGLELEIAPTPRGAALRLTFESQEDAWVTLLPAAGKILSVDREGGLVVGVSTAIATGAAVPGDFGCYFAVYCEPGFGATDTFAAPGAPPSPNGTAEGVALRLTLGGPITLRIATSFISAEQALLNLRREGSGRSFDEARAAASAEWEQQLARVAIDGATDAQQRTFYRCLYRSLLYPRRIDEEDASGQMVHRSFFNGDVHQGPAYTDIGFWDAHRSLMPLLTLIAPDEMARMIQGWLNTFREGGWLPSWASPGYIPCMVGSHAGVIIADAHAKGIRDFDLETAWAAVRHDALVEPPSFACGRSGLTRFNKLGWVPMDEFDHAAARTCDYALGDFGAAQLAVALGQTADAARFAQRALHYRQLYDAQAGFLRGRNADGSWPQPFQEFAWTRDYVEGGPWQHTWSAPHDAAGLIALLGGDEAFVAKLERMLALPPRFELGRYPTTIHEMTEMAAVPFGQYAHSNEPVHHVLHLFTAAGRPDLAQHWVRRVLNELYTPDAFCGDEDNGAMGSWYVLNALGLYALTPGHPAWVLGAPLFPRAVVQLGGGQALEIRTANFAPDAPYVADVHLNGRRVDSLELSHAALAGGGELVFTMTTDAACARARGKLPRPFSLSRSDAFRRP